MTLFCCSIFYFYNFKYQGSTDVSVKFITNYNGSGEKVDFDVFLLFFK